MSKRPRPLVFGTQRAAKEAARLLPFGVLLENVVADEILAGNVRRSGDELLVFRPNAWRATVRREPGRLRPRPRTWIVIDIEDLATTNRRNSNGSTHTQA